ncbi:hypothetical protein [Kitasatospora sp. NPDC088548]|uniref:hypothetical protein n=1 Tax=Kitasatospora sp. NPDC088548 TaxID=3364075 RepID=UPI00381AD4B6
MSDVPLPVTAQGAADRLNAALAARGLRLPTVVPALPVGPAGVEMVSLGYASAALVAALAALIEQTPVPAPLDQ